MIMKKHFTLLSLILISNLTSKNYAQITLTAENVPTYSDITLNDASAISDFSINDGVFNTWDFGDVTMPFAQLSFFWESNNPFFDAISDGFFYGGINALGETIDIESYYKTNVSSFSEIGRKINAKTTNLAFMTGVATDEIVYPEQQEVYSQPRELLKFPVDINYNNVIDVRKVLNFNLTIGAYALDNTPGQIVTHLHRADTVIAFGKMSVYTENGPSDFYDVLAIKSWQREIDSFYIGGMPAPQVLLDAFGLTQDYITPADYNNRINFFRANATTPLMTVLFEDSPFESYTGIYTEGDNLTILNTNELLIENYSVFIYPNPSVNRTISLQFIGKNVENVNYELFDLLGKKVSSEENKITNNNTLSINFSNEIEAGNYILKCSDKHGNIIANEKIQTQE